MDGLYPVHVGIPEIPDHHPAIDTILSTLRSMKKSPGLASMVNVYMEVS